MADTAEDTTAGKCVEIQHLMNHEVVAGLHTFPLRPIVPKSCGYWGQYLNSLRFRNQLFPLMQGTKVISLSRAAVSSVAVHYPSQPEQRLIGQFFKTLDSLIAAAERQEGLLKQKKQACLQLMFPQEGKTEPRLRFSAFNDTWKRIALASVLKINEERNNTSEFGFDRTISVSTMHFKPEGNGAAHASLETYRVLRVGDVAFEGNRHKEYPYGHVVINDIGDGLMSSRFRSFRPTRPICVPFWKYLLQNRYIMTPLLLRSTMRGTLMNELVVDDFLRQRIPMPSLHEQLKIGDFFEKLDRLVENAEGRIVQLRKMKSSYLQKLFI
ncbi:type I restriction-modification system, specificity subunit S [Pseudoscardovia radai]|uniref:Type I restriction-modification system, specificity subunit S n=2 Tax=Pseudoscardovia radai TaxID=987066 RepID=A0A261ER88_9BIFI|nr:type I restriction-modification system, specificity subunit S [Pseudoscardovia radai]